MKLVIADEAVRVSVVDIHHPHWHGTAELLEVDLNLVGGELHILVPVDVLEGIGEHRARVLIGDLNDLNLVPERGVPHDLT